MNKASSRKLNNDGFSLIELIVVILLMSMVVGMIAIFMSSSRKMYATTETSATLRNESEITKSFISELVLEATNFDTFSAPSLGAKGVWILAPDNSYLGINKDAGGPKAMDYCYYFLLLESDTNIIRFMKVDDEDTGIKNGSGVILGEGFDYDAFFTSSTGVYHDPYAVLAEHISDIRLSRNNGLVTVYLDLIYNSKGYSTSVNIAARNLK